MTYQVKFSRRAEKDLHSLPQDAAWKILDSLELLRINPFAEILQFKKLKTNQSLYRIRIGNYRMIYEVKAGILVIVVIRVGHRKDVYRYLKDR